MSPASEFPARMAMQDFYAEHVHSHIHATPEQTLQKYRQRIVNELARFGIAADQFKDKTVLDVGSGWQAIVFQALGCGRIYHLDIDFKHVDFLKTYIREHGIDNIISEQADISRTLGSAKDIDLAFIAGVYHHLTDREGFINRILPAMSKNSEILFRVYRAGTWSRWLVAALRTVSIGKFSPEHLLVAYRMLQPYGQDNQFVGDMIDDLLTPQWLAFQPWQFRADAEKLGLACRCLSDEFEYDFSARDENFRVSWRLPANRTNVIIPTRLSTGIDHISSQTSWQSGAYTDLQNDVNALLSELNQLAPRDAALIVVALYFLVRRHHGVDAYLGGCVQAPPNPDLAAWRVNKLRESLKHFHAWLQS